MSLTYTLCNVVIHLCVVRTPSRCEEITFSPVVSETLDSHAVVSSGILCAVRSLRSGHSAGPSKQCGEVSSMYLIEVNIRFDLTCLLHTSAVRSQLDRSSLICAAVYPRTGCAGRVTLNC